MNDAMRYIQTVAAIAIYVEKGAVYAASYLKDNGWTTNEAFELIELYDNYVDQIKAGRVG